MKQVKCVADRDVVIGEVSRDLFGSFIEHLGRAVYKGIYEPGHPLADNNGFRKDVIECVKSLGVGLVRYPGGNFVSGYDWKDGIGPKEKRPRRLELAWRSIETNEFGIDEFADWAGSAGVGVMGAINLGTGTPKDAGELLEYCNHPGGTYWSDLRAANGHREPHNIKVWCLGNEMDGPWQIGQMSAPEYGVKAREAAKIMRWVDPSIRLVACGSSTTRIPSYPEWDKTVLEHLYDHVDYLSLHRYYENEGDLSDYLASFHDMDQFIKTISGVVGYVKAKTRSRKQVYLSFDEWNIWYQKNQKNPESWETAPSLLEDNYSLLDSLVFGGLLCTLLNNADTVRMACLAQLVNVIAPIMTKPGGGLFRQTIFHPFAQVSGCGKGKVLRTLTHSPVKVTKSYGEVPAVQSVLIHDEESGALTLFALNTLEDESVGFALDLRSFGNVSVKDHIVMDGPDVSVKNTFDDPDRVVPRSERSSISAQDKGMISVVLPKLSWNMVRMSSDAR